MMLLASLRDLQWRRRRFLIAVLGTSLIFAMTLVLTGLSHGFDVEAADTVDSFDADAWVVPEDAPGPFLGAVPFTSETVAEVGADPGVEVAGEFVFGHKSIGEGSSLVDVNVFGATPGGPATPEPSQGRVPQAPGEIMVSTTLDGADIGDTLDLSGEPFSVVGRVSNWTAIAGVANVFLVAADAQKVLFSGAPLVSAVATRGVPQSAPAGFVVIDSDAALDDLLRPINESRGAITFVAILLWIVAALIIGSVVYLSALERVRDFAVFKAVGVRTRAIMGGLVLQAAILGIAASLVGMLVGMLLAPLFPMRVEIPTAAFLGLPGIALVVGIVASTLGMRRVMTVDPALAFGGP